mgnify:CR=1 FL=1
MSTPAARRQIAAAFRHARQRIECRYNTFICVALLDSRAPAYKKARRIVQKRIHPHVELDHWVKVQCPEAHLTEKNMRAYRLAWLDELIKEFES